VPRQISKLASPVGLHASDLFRTATLRPDQDGAVSEPSVEQALAPLWPGRRRCGTGSELLHPRRRKPRSRGHRVSVLAEDASLLGTDLVLTDKTDLERYRHDQKRVRRCLRNSRSPCASLGTITGYAEQLASNRDPETALRLADASLARRRNWIVRSAVSWEAPGLPHVS